MTRHLGDSVYAAIDNGYLRLTYDEGRGPTNTIFLQPEALVRLWLFLAEAAAQAGARGPLSSVLPTPPNGTPRPQ